VAQSVPSSRFDRLGMRNEGVDDPAMTKPEESIDWLDACRRFCAGSPHNIALGVEAVEEGEFFCVLRLPWRADLVGDPDTGVLMGGVVTTMMDNASGFSAWRRLGRFASVATLDLRIDYLRPATRGMALLARAECYRMTRHIAFTRGTAWHATQPDKPVATSAGAFMLDTKTTRKRA
jgi:uncharacterized protein (TIGR00369 family)